MGALSKRILWVGASDPWSPWTLSGISQAICKELSRRDLLLGAIWPDGLSLRHMRRPGPLYCLEHELWKRTRRYFPQREWHDESKGLLGRALRLCPPNTRVIYALVRPHVLDLTLPVMRFRWMDLSMDDAARSGAFGHSRFSAAEILAMRTHEDRMLRASEGVVALSTYAADAISRDLGYPRDRITPIGAGPAVETEVDRYATERYAAARVLFVGRDWERKGGPLVLEAVRLLRESIPHATLTVVGLKQPPPCPYDFVHFLGVFDKGEARERKRLAEVFRTSSVFCMASSIEPWGLAYVEAAQAGLPVVALRDWALPDIVEDGVTGELSPQRDAAGLARALLRALGDPARTAEMGRRAQERVRQVLAWPHVVDRLLSRVLPEALGDRPAIPLQG